MSQTIKHTGIVVATDGDWVDVRIVKTSACAACEARRMCNSSESRIELMHALAQAPMQVGDEVEVHISQQMGRRAVILAYVLPLILFTATAIGLSRMGYSDAIIGSGILLTLVIYYTILACFRTRLEHQFSITAHKPT